MTSQYKAHFQDGLSAREHQVSVVLSPSGLQFEADGRTHFWPASGLTVQDVIDGRPRLSHADFPEARLFFESQEATTVLGNSLPGLFRGRRDGWRRETRQIGIFSLVILGLAGLIYLSLPAIAGTITALVPIEYEQRLGRSVLKQVGAIFEGADQQCTRKPSLKELNFMRYSLTVGTKLRVPINVRVMPVDVVNAFALPGGYIIIFQGLIDKAESAEEVAAVLAHEIGHTQYRHGMQGLVRSNAVRFLVSIVAPGLGDVGAELGTALIGLSYTRDAEREADGYALEMLNRHNFKATGFAAFFRRLQQEFAPDEAEDKPNAKREPPSMLSTHPALEERIERIIREGKGGDSIMSDRQWQSLRKICSVTSAIK